MCLKWKAVSYHESKTALGDTDFDSLSPEELDAIRLNTVAKDHPPLLHLAHYFQEATRLEPSFADLGPSGDRGPGLAHKEGKHRLRRARQSKRRTPLEMNGARPAGGPGARGDNQPGRRLALFLSIPTFFYLTLYGVMAFIGVSLVEGIVLRLLKWSSFWRSLLDSLLMNFVSSAVGYLLALNLSSLPWVGFGSMFTSPSSLLLLFVLSVATETGMLLLLHRRPLRRIATAVVIVNLVSYLGFVALGILGAEANRVDQPTFDAYGSDEDMALVGDQIYLLDGSHGLQILEVSDRSSPRRTASIGGTDWGWSEALVADGQTIFIAEQVVSPMQGGGLRVVDVTIPEAPVEVGYYSEPLDATDLTVQGGYAYVCSWELGVLVVDISSPAEPTKVGLVEMTWGATDIAANQDYAFVASAGQGIVVLDLSKPQAPAHVGVLEGFGDVHVLRIVDQYLYVASDKDRLSIVDVSDPLAPRQVGFYVAEGPIEDVAAAGSFAYLAVRGIQPIYGDDPISGLVVLDVSNPASPIEAGVYRPVRRSGNAWSFYPLHVALSGERAYVLDPNGLWVVDVSRADHPTLVSSD